MKKSKNKLRIKKNSYEKITPLIWVSVKNFYIAEFAKKRVKSMEEKSDKEAGHSEVEYKSDHTFYNVKEDSPTEIKKETAITNTKNNENKNSKESNLNISANEVNDMKPKDGCVTLKLSANRIFAGGSVIITGESIKYKNFNQVEITVTGPSKDVKSIPLYTNGKYNTVWNKSEQST